MEDNTFIKNFKNVTVRLVGRKRVNKLSSPVYKWMARRQTKKLIETIDQRNLKLNVGCGYKPMTGWLNIDIAIGIAEIVWDVRKNLPLLDESCSAVFCEHLIEHLDKAHGLSLIKEFYRVLQPGGVLRISTPDAGKYLRSYVFNDGFLHHQNLITTPESPMDRINVMMRENGSHLWIYDNDSLSNTMLSVGFETIITQQFGISCCTDMMFIDSIEREHESLYIEAVK